MSFLFSMQFGNSKAGISIECTVQTTSVCGGGGSAVCTRTPRGAAPHIAGAEKPAGKCLRAETLCFTGKALH